MKRDGVGWTRREWLVRAASIAVTSLAVFPAVHSPALADFTPSSAKRAYDRYSGRIREGARLLHEWEAAIPSGNAWPSGEVDVKDPRSEISKLSRAMNIYAGVFSNNYESEKSRELRDYVTKMNEAIKKATMASDDDARRSHLAAARDAYERYKTEAHLNDG